MIHCTKNTFVTTGCSTVRMKILPRCNTFNISAMNRSNR